MDELNVRIYHIPTPASYVDVAKYSHLRLEALRTNPEAYSSTYERDVHLTHDEWKSRVNTVGRTTLAAIVPNPDTQSIGLEGDWVGTLSVLHPSMLQPEDLPYIPRVSDGITNGTVERYLLVGMWVHPRARKKGVGRMLIENAVELVKSANGARSEGAKKIIFLKVFVENKIARGLYLKAGLVERPDCEGPEKDVWMTVTLA